MDKLSQFYISLATQAGQLAAFNGGQSAQERKQVRTRMMKNAGLDESHIDAVLEMDQEALREHMAKLMAAEDPQWSGFNASTANNQTNNNVSAYGRRKAH